MAVFKDCHQRLPKVLLKLWRVCGGVLVVVFLWWCFCGGVFCGGVGFCGGVVVFVWWCGVFAVVVLFFVVVWWCFCSGVVFLWFCFCGGVVVKIVIKDCPKFC